MGAVIDLAGDAPPNAPARRAAFRGGLVQGARLELCRAAGLAVPYFTVAGFMPHRRTWARAVALGRELAAQPLIQWQAPRRRPQRRPF